MKAIKKLIVVFGLLSCFQQAMAFSLLDGLDFKFFEDEEAPEVTLWKDGPNQYFKLASQDDKSFGPNDHPVDLNENVVELALGLVRLKGRDADSFNDLEPVFTKDQIALIGPHLARGLKQAAPKQDVLFVFERTKQKLLGLKRDSYFIAGRAFYKDGRLNIIFGDYERDRNRGYETAYDPSNAGIVSYSFNHGKRSEAPEGSNVFDKAIYDLPGLENKKLKELRRDWIVIDLSVASDAYAHQEEMERQQELTRKRRELEEIFGQSLPQIVQQHSNTGVAPSPKKNAEDRLTTLNKLKQKGLVTEEEYEAKRKQILEEL